MKSSLYNHDRFVFTITWFSLLTGISIRALQDLSHCSTYTAGRPLLSYKKQRDNVYELIDYNLYITIVLPNMYSKKKIIYSLCYEAILWFDYSDIFRLYCLIIYVTFVVLAY